MTGTTTPKAAKVRRPPAAAPGTQPNDHVPDYRALATWAADAGLLSTRQRRRLIAAADSDPDAAIAVHLTARRLREAIYQAFSELACGEPAPTAALDLIRDTYLDALHHGAIRPSPDGLGWHWPDDDRLQQVQWPIARSAVELAVSDRLTRIRQCPGDDGRCGWLFVDTSKNATRRWCSMSTCGSRVKSRRQTDRLRAARAPPRPAAES